MFGSLKGNKRVLLVDVGSGSAASAILSISKGKPAEIIAAHRSALTFEDRSEDATLAGIVAAISESVEKVHTAAPGRVDGAHAIIRAPWSHSKTVRAVERFEKETRIRADMIAQMAQQALAEDKELDHSKLIEATVIRAELNGYPTAHPEGKHAHSLFVAVLASECDPRIKSALLDALGKFFATTPIIHSGTKALLGILREREATHANFLIFNMTGIATSIVSVHKDTAVGHALVKEGVRTILKRIGGDKLPEETLSLARMIAQDRCDTSACEAVKAGMAKAEPELIRVFAESFSALAAERKLPKTLVLVTEPALADWLSQFFARIDFTQFTVTTQPFTVEALRADEMRTSVQSPDPKFASDYSLMLGATFVRSQYQQK